MDKDIIVTNSRGTMDEAIKGKTGLISLGTAFATNDLTGSVTGRTKSSTSLVKSLISLGIILS